MKRIIEEYGSVIYCTLIAVFLLFVLCPNNFNASFARRIGIGIQPAIASGVEVSNTSLDVKALSDYKDTDLPTVTVNIYSRDLDVNYKFSDLFTISNGTDWAISDATVKYIAMTDVTSTLVRYGKIANQNGTKYYIQELLESDVDINKQLGTLSSSSGSAIARYDGLGDERIGQAATWTVNTTNHNNDIIRFKETGIYEFHLWLQNPNGRSTTMVARIVVNDL